MKKIYYFIGLMCIVFASCKPLSKTYDAIDAMPSGDITLSLTIAEYKSLPTTNYANTGLYFKSMGDANLYIPTILAAKYPGVADLLTANVTFALAPSSSSIAAPDSTLSRISIVLATPADHNFPSTTNGNDLIPGNTVAYFTADAAINYLRYKYPTPAAYQTVVMTYNYLETGITATTGSTVTDTFAYIGGSWVKLYTLTPAQYASVNRGANNMFLTTDVPNLVYYINNILMSDPTLMVSAKTGQAISVSYKYNTLYQRVLNLTYNGSSWVPKQTLAFLKVKGIWLPDPTVTLTEPVGVNPDYAWLRDFTTIGASTARSNVASFGDFDVRTNGANTAWSDADLTAALAAILLHRFPTPTAGIPYKVVYYAYNGAVFKATKNFLYNGTAFVQQ